MMRFVGKRQGKTERGTIRNNVACRQQLTISRKKEIKEEQLT